MCVLLPKAKQSTLAEAHSQACLTSTNARLGHPQMALFCLDKQSMQESPHSWLEGLGTTFYNMCMRDCYHLAIFSFLHEVSHHSMG